MAKDFIKTWNGRRLEDWGSTVSKEYKQFQQAMKREVARLAEAEGAKLASYNSGHYYQSGFVERDGLYVYFCYEAIDRCHVQLTDGFVFYMRTASGPKDYRGGSNCNVSFSEFTETMKRLFSQQAQDRLHKCGGAWVSEYTSSHGYRFELALFDIGVHARVYSPDGTLLYHNEKWPGTWAETYKLYEASRQKMQDESSDFYGLLSQLSKDEKLRNAA